MNYTKWIVIAGIISLIVIHSRMLIGEILKMRRNSRRPRMMTLLDEGIVVLKAKRYIDGDGDLAAEIQIVSDNSIGGVKLQRCKNRAILCYKDGSRPLILTNAVLKRAGS